eukprot:364202-Chlamydomonas_euryale.AAC.6
MDTPPREVVSCTHARVCGQVLSHFVVGNDEAAERQRERLEYFGSAEGRDDLYRQVFLHLVSPWGGTLGR